MIKKRLICCLLLVMMGGVFSGCSILDSEDDDDDVVLSVAGPQGVVVDQDKIYVALTNLSPTTFAPGGPGLIAVISPQTNRVEKTILLSHTNPQSLVKTDQFPNTIFVVETGDYVDPGMIEAINTTTDEIMDGITMPGSPIKLAFAANGQGLVTDGTFGAGITLMTFQFDGQSFSSVSEVQVTTNGFPQDIQVRESDNTVFVADLSNDLLYILDEDGNTLEDPIVVNDAPGVIVFDDTDILVVGSPFQGNGFLAKITAPDNDGVRTVDTEAAVLGLIPNAAKILNNELAIVQSGSHSVLFLDLETLTVNREISTGNGTNPFQIACLPDGQLVITHLLSHEVAIFDPTELDPEMTEIELPDDDDLMPFSTGF